MVKLSKKQNDNNKNNNIAIIKGGKHNGEIVSFDNSDNEPSLKCENLFDYMSVENVKKHKKYMTSKELLALKRAIEHDEVDTNIRDIYDKIKPTIDNAMNKHIHINDGDFSVMPKIQEHQINRCFVSGQSGCGKSTWINEYAKEYQKIFPKNKIYIISRHDTDETLEDGLKNIKRLKITEELLDVEIDISDFKNSLTIYDDTETIQNPKLKKLIFNLRSDMLQNSRHHNTYLMCVEHQILNQRSTKLLILECDLIIVFPRSGSYQIKNYLKSYESYSKEEINLIMNIPSRWICINRNFFPKVIIGENDIYII